MPAHRWHRTSAALLGVAVLGLSGCSSHRDPEVALREAEARLQANDPAGADRILRDIIASAPQDPRLRIAQARAELASGNAGVAEGILRRALALGASRADVAPYLAQSLLAQGASFRAIEWIGDLGQWPRQRQLRLALIKAEAELAQPSANPLELTKLFVDVFRRRASAEKDAATADLPWVDARLTTLRKQRPIVAAAYEHFTCVRDEQRTSAEPDLLPAATSVSGRRVLKVGPQHPLHRPSDAARIAKDNDIIEIEGGSYLGDVAAWTQSGLLLRGVNGRPQLDSQGRTARDQGIWVFSGNDIIVENIEFSGARSRARNGSGIRFLGRNLTIRDSVFHHNEDGVLTWNDPDSDVVIERSVFAHNGAGDGQSHNIYIGRMRSFTLRFSHSHDAKSGHEVKSRARTNYVLYNRLTDEENGNSSYLIDLPEGGQAYVIGNILEKGANAENPNAISFAAERPDIEEGALWVINNDFYNRYAIATFVANRSTRPVVIANNVLAGAPVLVRTGPADEHTNFQRPQQGMVDPASYDFRLLADSPLIDAGADPGKVGEMSLWPQFEYVHPASGRKRQRIGNVDLGAHEFCGW